jgi:3-carboxy-cis,cis-muconate cycloisomerase
MRDDARPRADLFAGIYARGQVAQRVDGHAWLRAMLDVESALARACSDEGLIPFESADAIASACRGDDFDLDAIARDAAAHATPVIALVNEIRQRVGPDAAPHVHLGATSQDVVDTAAMLVAHRSLTVIVMDAAGAAEAAARLAHAHRSTAMAGRTLLQPACPTSFGLKAAGWLIGIEEAISGLVAVRESVLAVQMGGPVGQRDPGMASAVASELGLAEPVLPWHTHRGRPVALAAGLGVLAGVLGKVARDVSLLAQGEIAEVREAGGPAPIASVSVLACAKRVPGLVSTAMAAMDHEHERAAGSWQAEWGTLADMLRLTGSAAAWARDLLEGLEVDADRMRENLERLGLEGDLGAADALIDRALLAHRAAPR